MPNSAYWDSCVFIESLQKSNQERLDACLDLIDKAEKGNLVIFASALAITEVNKFDAGNPPTISREDQSKFILRFFGNAYIRIKSVDREIAELAHGYTRTLGVLPLDAIHAATAAVSNVEVLYTYDAMKGRRRGLLLHNLKIARADGQLLRIEQPPKSTLLPGFAAGAAAPPPPPATPPPATTGS